MTQPVLDIQQLHLSFPGFNGDVHALNNVSLQINREFSCLTAYHR